MHVQLQGLGLHQHAHSLHSCSILDNVTLQPFNLPHVVLQLLPLLATAAVAAASCRQRTVWSANTCSTGSLLTLNPKQSASCQLVLHSEPRGLTSEVGCI